MRWCAKQGHHGNERSNHGVTAQGPGPGNGRRYVACREGIGVIRQGLGVVREDENIRVREPRGRLISSVSKNAVRICPQQQLLRIEILPNEDLDNLGKGL